jgi:hypothetical protein
MNKKPSLVETILGEEKCEKGMYWCNTDEACKPIPSGFNTPGQTIKPTEVGVGKPVKGSCNHTKKGKVCPIHGKSNCPVDEAGYKQVRTKKKGKKMVPNCVPEQRLLDKIIDELQETSKSGDDNLKDWFRKSSGTDPKTGKKVPGWVQLGGKFAGAPCAKQPGQTTKPKCGSSKMASEMSPEEEEKAAARKRKEDPNPDRKGEAINVKTESKIYEAHKEIASGEKKDREGYMARNQLDTITKAVASLKKNIKKGNQQLPAWVQSKITKSADYIDTAADYIDSDEMSEEKDACYTKVKSRYKVWPSAYASGALVKCRKVGAKNWGNKSKNEEFVNEGGDWWHPDPEKDKKLLGKGPQMRAREDRGQDNSKSKKTKPDYSKRLKPGETYMQFAKRKQAERVKEDITIEDLNGNTFAEVIDIIKPEPVKGFKSQVEEATRLQADTGNIISVILSWRGKTYSVRMFFPQVGMPSKKDVTTEIQKIYPRALVLQYKVSSIQPGMPLIQVMNSKSKNYNMNEESAAWQRKEGKNPEGGLNAKGVASYRKENPGSKLQTAVTKEPSKLKPGSKDAKRRKSFCARMGGMPGPMKDEKGRPTRKALSLRKWNC